MIGVWILVGVAGCLALSWLLRRAQAIGQREGFEAALEGIHVVARAYAEGDPTPLPPHLAELAQHMGAAAIDLRAGDERVAAEETERMRKAARVAHAARPRR